jgi:hypothetical protein
MINQSLNSYNIWLMQTELVYSIGIEKQVEMGKNPVKAK